MKTLKEKRNSIHHIITTWVGENKIGFSWSFKQQEKLVDKLCKYLKIIEQKGDLK